MIGGEAVLAAYKVRDGQERSRCRGNIRGKKWKTDKLSRHRGTRNAVDLEYFSHIYGLLEVSSGACLGDDQPNLMQLERRAGRRAKETARVA